MRTASQTASPLRASRPHPPLVDPRGWPWAGAWRRWAESSGGHGAPWGGSSHLCLAPSRSQPPACPRPLLPPSPLLPQASTVLLIPSMASRRSHPGILEPSVHQHSQINFQPGSHLWALNTERGSHTLSPMWGASVRAQSPVTPLRQARGCPGSPDSSTPLLLPALPPACPRPASKPTALPQHQPSQGTLPHPEGRAGGSMGLCTLRAAPWQAPTVRQGSPGSTGPSSPICTSHPGPPPDPRHPKVSRPCPCRKHPRWEEKRDLPLNL